MTTSLPDQNQRIVGSDVYVKMEANFTRMFKESKDVRKLRYLLLRLLRAHPAWVEQIARHGAEARIQSEKNLFQTFSVVSSLMMNITGKLFGSPLATVNAEDPYYSGSKQVADAYYFLVVIAFVLCTVSVVVGMVHLACLHQWLVELDDYAAYQLQFFQLIKIFTSTSLWLSIVAFAFAVAMASIMMLHNPVSTFALVIMLIAIAVLTAVNRLFFSSALTNIVLSVDRSRLAAMINRICDEEIDRCTANLSSSKGDDEHLLQMDAHGKLDDKVSLPGQMQLLK